MAGCGNSKNIVSIDKNAEANIFNDALLALLVIGKISYPAF
ncbi:MAG: hypothetical protein CM1200mP33_6240 [Chloroflexota bacterium]|nr:MAG: hypothetical protein CM1200mP33_6240 [Chloroflexota bacterium]